MNKPTTAARLEPIIKTEENGLLRKSFKMRTPKVNDEDVKSLIKLYPPSLIEN